MSSLNVGGNPFSQVPSDRQEVNRGLENNPALNSAINSLTARMGHLSVNNVSPETNPRVSRSVKRELFPTEPVDMSTFGVFS